MLQRVGFPLNAQPDSRSSGDDPLKSMVAIDYIAQNWETIAAAPVAVLTLMSLASVIGFTFARYKYATLAEIAHQRREFFQDQVKWLDDELRSLKLQANSSGTIEELRAKIERLPRIFSGPRPPIDARDGDVWFQTE
jgi:hypothetical protein